MKIAIKICRALKKAAGCSDLTSRNWSREPVVSSQSGGEQGQDSAVDTVTILAPGFRSGPHDVKSEGPRAASVAPEQPGCLIHLLLHDQALSTPALPKHMHAKCWLNY